MNNSARQVFKGSGLTYNDMFDHQPVLRNEIEKELSLLAASGGMEMTLSKRKSRIRFVPGTRDIGCFFLTVDGPCFKCREAVSFNSGGFIGFAGWASTENVAPIINGFLAAIDKIKAESV